MIAKLTGSQHSRHAEDAAAFDQAPLDDLPPDMKLRLARRSGLGSEGPSTPLHTESSTLFRGLERRSSRARELS